MIQTSFFPQPEKDKPVKIIQINPSGLQPMKMEEINYRICANLLPDTYMIYPTGGYHLFYGVPNTFPRYQLPIWPFIRRIKYDHPKYSRNKSTGQLQTILHPKNGYMCISLQEKGHYDSNQYTKKKKKGFHIRDSFTTKDPLLCINLLRMPMFPIQIINHVSCTLMTTPQTIFLRI